MTTVLAQLGERAYDRAALEDELGGLVPRLRFDPGKRVAMQVACRELVEVLDGLAGATLQERWTVFEWEVWPRWIAGDGRPPRHRWTLGVCALVIGRAVRPSWAFLQASYTRAWLKRAPVEEPLARETERLRSALGEVRWATELLREKALKVGARIMLVAGHEELEQITDADLRAVPTVMTSGSDVLDAALCALGVLDRSPQRGAARRMRGQRLTAAEPVERSRVPERFQAVQVLYLETYGRRISDVYATIRHKHNSLEHLWCFIDERFPRGGRVRRGAPGARARVHPARDRARPRGPAPSSAPRRPRQPDRPPVADQRALLLRRRLHVGDRGRLAVSGVRAAGGAAGAPRPRRRRV